MKNRVFTIISVMILSILIISCMRESDLQDTWWVSEMVVDSDKIVISVVDIALYFDNFNKVKLISDSGRVDELSYKLSWNTISFYNYNSSLSPDLAVYTGSVGTSFINLKFFARDVSGKKPEIRYKRSTKDEVNKIFDKYKIKLK